VEGYHGGKDRKGMGEDLVEATEAMAEEALLEADEYVDPEAPKVTKIKRYDVVYYIVWNCIHAVRHSLTR
jgi:hypothetical protein